MGQSVYINGKIVARERAVVPALDRGLLYGYGLFETMRSYGGRVFRLDRHLGRLMRSAKALGIADALDVAALEAGIADALKANCLTDARIRLTVTAGEGERAIGLPASGKLTTIIVAEALLQLSHNVQAKGLRASIVSIRRNSKSPLCRMKTLGYLENMLAREEAVKAGSDEAILLNEDGLVAECSASNIFIVEGVRLVTPTIADGILEGVTRGVVIELAGGLGISVSEENVSVDRLIGAEDVFITNSIIELAPVTSIDGKLIGAGISGEITERLANAYRNLVQSGVR
jgi:branched-chain amino acid aminotransferase